MKTSSSKISLISFPIEFPRFCLPSRCVASAVIGIVALQVIATVYHTFQLIQTTPGNDFSRKKIFRLAVSAFFSPWTIYSAIHSSTASSNVCAQKARVLPNIPPEYELAEAIFLTKGQPEHDLILIFTKFVNAREDEFAFIRNLFTSTSDTSYIPVILQTLCAVINTDLPLPNNEELLYNKICTAFSNRFSILFENAFKDTRYDNWSSFAPSELPYFSLNQNQHQARKDILDLNKIYLQIHSKRFPKAPKKPGPPLPLKEKEEKIISIAYTFSQYSIDYGPPEEIEKAFTFLEKLNDRDQGQEPNYKKFQLMDESCFTLTNNTGNTLLRAYIETGKHFESLPFIFGRFSSFEAHEPNPESESEKLPLLALLLQQTLTITKVSKKIPCSHLKSNCSTSLILEATDEDRPISKLIRSAQALIERYQSIHKNSESTKAYIEKQKKCITDVLAQTEDPQDAVLLLSFTEEIKTKYDIDLAPASLINLSKKIEDTEEEKSE